MHGTVKDAPQLAASHGRFVTLDALRGVAAIFVVWRHFGLNLGGYVPPFSYLAVDLFFVLSGFVLAYANDKRFSAGQTRVTFLKKRVIRVWPLYLLGLLIGLGAQLLSPEGGLQGDHLGVATALNAVGLPSPFMTAQGNPFPLNHVFWSIFFELWVANLAFGLFWKQLHGKALLALILVSAFGLLVSEKLFYTVDVGMIHASFFAGFARVGFSFFAGVALARLHAARPPRLRVPSLAIVVLLCALFWVPLHERAAHLFELGAVLLAFPAMIYWGASAVERRPKIGLRLGDASYALYAIHHPFFRIALALFGTAPFLRSPALQIPAIGTLGGVAWLLAKGDERIRRHLTRLIFRKP